MTPTVDHRPFDGSPEWRASHVLKDGTRIEIRPIFPSDRDELRREFARSSTRTRFLRFFTITPELSDATLDYLTKVDQQEHVALVATMESPDLKSERGIAVARFIAVGDGAAEAAITVTDDMQRKGLGTILATELGEAAKFRGLKSLRAEVLADNDTMRKILVHAGAKEVESHGATIAFDVALERSLADILRGAAQTMAVGIRKLALPATSQRQAEDGGADREEGGSGGG